MNAFLEHRNFAQHPQLLPALAEDPHDVGSNPFLGMQASARPAASAATRDTTVHLRLDAVSGGLRDTLSTIPGVAIVAGGGDLVVRQRGDEVQLLGPAGDPIVAAKTGDPALIKRIAAQAWLNRTLPAADDSLGLRAETDPGSRGNTYVQCESFVFAVRLQKPAFIMLLNLDAQGNLTVLYPTRAAERQVIASGAAVAIPGKDPMDRILVAAPFGTDQVAVLAFDHQPAFFDELNSAERFAADGRRATALGRGLASVRGAVAVQQITVRTYPGGGSGLCGS
jgi:hypothetical protein